MHNRRYYILVLSVIISVLHVYSQDSIRSSINKELISIGEQAIITLKAQLPAKSQIEFPSYDSLQSIIRGIEVLSQKDSTYSSGTDMIHIRKYNITSFDSATYRIPPFKVEIDGKSHSSNPINLKVQSVDIDTTKLDKIYDLKPSMEPTFDISEWSWPLIISVITFLVSLILVYIIIRLKDNKPIIRRFKFSPYIPPHKTAIAEISKLREEEPNQEEYIKKYYTQLTDILRKYLQGRYGINAMEMTTDEIVAELEKVNDASLIKEMQELFTTADLVKFAKVQPDMTENDRNLVNALSYIQNTKKEEVIAQSPKEIIVEDVRSKKAKRVLYIATAIVSILLLLTTIYLIQYIYILKY